MHVTLLLDLQDGKPYVLNVIRKAERMLLEDETRTKVKNDHKFQ